MQNESAILVKSDKVGYVEICTTQWECKADIWNKADVFSFCFLIVLPCAPCPAVHFLPVVPWCVSHLCCCLWSALLKVCLDGDTPNPIFCVDLVLGSHNEKKALVVRGAFNTICSAQCGGTFPLSQHQAPEQQLDSFRTDWNREPRLMSL